MGDHVFVPLAFGGNPAAPPIKTRAIQTQQCEALDRGIGLFCISDLSNRFELPQDR